MSRIPRHERMWKFRRGEDDEEEDSDKESDEGGSLAATVAGGQQRDACRHHRSSEDNKKKKKYTNEDGDEWGESQQKKDIIAAFLDKDSGIHALSTTEIFEQYAADHGWIKKNATANIRRLRNQLDGKEGPFFEKEVSTNEPFKTRKTKSKAYTLLLKLHMMSEQSGINNMTVEQLHQSQACFRQYPLKDFKSYNADITKLAHKKKAKLTQDTAVFQRHMKAHPRQEVTDRGLKFWDTHIAFEMLKEDFDNIEKGLLDPSTPKLLWESRNSYKEFPLEVFKNHYFQELRKRKESNFWRHKMKLIARKEHLAEVDKLYDEWLWNDIDGDEFVKKFNANLEVNTKEENQKANADLRRVHGTDEFWRRQRR